MAKDSVDVARVYRRILEHVCGDSVMHAALFSFGQHFPSQAADQRRQAVAPRRTRLDPLIDDDVEVLSRPLDGGRNFANR